MKLFTRGAIILLLLLSLPVLSAFGVTANFTASTLSGCSPLVVNFHNTSTPMAGTTFSWNLGLGGMPITLTDASSSYILPGTYVVTLTATNGSSVSTHSVTITVYPSPTVSFSADDTTVCPGTTVTFTSTTVGGVPGPVTCTWNFGDGFSGSGTTTSHTYTTPGWYNVTLSATNANGCISSLTKFSYIHVYTPATPSFTVNSNYFCSVPGHAIFTNTTSGFGPYTYSWRFGDGGTSTATNPVHDYTATGTYNVTLIVTDGHGCMDSVTMSSYITVANLNAAFTYPSTACVNSTVSFVNTSSTHISSSWDFGDGQYSSLDAGANMYHTPGTYTVRLIVFDGHCYDTVFHTITILPGPVTTFTITPTNPCPPPVTISYTGTAPTGTTVSWIYGDGTTGTGLSSSHTYYIRGIHTVSMIAVDPTTGCRDTVKQQDTLYDMVHWITANPYSGCKPLPVTFGANFKTWVVDTSVLHPYPYPISTYSWNFGDGSPTSSASAPTHTYTAVGVYQVILTSVTSNGCTVYDTVQIHVGAPPVVTFTATPTHTCYHNNSVVFTATVISGPVDSFFWQFGDGSEGSTSTGGITHHYVLPGVFSVTLTPYYNGCPGVPFVRTDYITIDSPMAIIKQTVLCSPAKRVVFGDSSLGDDTHIWFFGDGGTSTADNPVHDYAAFIVYTVMLTTYNAASGCRDTAYGGVDLTRPSVTFVASDTAICKDDHTSFTSTVTGGSASSYAWHMAGWSADSVHATAIDTFHTPGIFSVTLIIRDQNGCYDTFIRNNYILVAKPNANFTVSPATGCWPLTTTFTDASTDVPGTFFTGFEWAFGDGGTASVTSTTVSHTYTAAGTFATTEIVTDNVGCKDTVVNSLVTVYRPSAAFTASTVNPCRIDSVHFLNTSTGIVSSFWMFGDGGTSSLYSPAHRYPAAGTYTVKLVVTDSHGCTDTMTRVNYIAVHQPSASFYMSDSVSICPPLMVVFHNTSTGGIFHNWDLGDGSTSTLFSPTDLYITTGYDTVRLIESDMYGCRDTAYGHINIFGYAGAFSYGPGVGCAPVRVNFIATTLNVPNITWDFADGTTSAVSFTDTISHVYTLPGAYLPKLILSDNSGCQNSSIGVDTIKVDAVYPGYTSVPNPVCIGDTFLLVDSSSSYFSTINAWNWSFNSTTSTIDSPSFIINVAGIYPVSLTVTDGWGCSATISGSVEVHGLPIITASPDTIICVGDAATLVGSGGVSYTWADAATLSCTACNPTLASPSVITTYTVTGTDIYGCRNIDTVTVDLKTHTISVARGDTSICVGVQVQLFDSGGTKYNWIPSLGLNDPHSATPIATPGSTTKYMAIAQLAGCIPDTNYVIIYVYPLPTVDAGPDQTLVAGSDAQLNATGSNIYTMAWDKVDLLSCDSCANPVAHMEVTTTFYVGVTSSFGCRNGDSVTIHIFCDKSQLFIPNSFTPNNDGENDIFYPRGIGVSIVKSFRIYNRWGQLLFERSGINLNDASNAWDGSFQGSTPKPDVYVYVLDAVCETGEPINVKGDVTIIR